MRGVFADANKKREAVPASMCAVLLRAGIIALALVADPEAASSRCHKMVTFPVVYPSSRAQPVG